MTAVAARYEPGVRIKKLVFVLSGLKIERLLSILGKPDFVQIGLATTKITPEEFFSISAVPQANQRKRQRTLCYHFGWVTFGTIDGEVVEANADYHVLLAGPPATGTK